MNPGPADLRITKRAVDSLAPRERYFIAWDSDLKGFGCKATPAGRKVYIVQYRTKRQDSKESAHAVDARQACLKPREVATLLRKLGFQEVRGLTDASTELVDLTATGTLVGTAPT